MGELKKKNDWSLDINYQVVQAQAVPDYDSVGIGLGNHGRFGVLLGRNPSPGPGSVLSCPPQGKQRKEMSTSAAT